MAALLSACSNSKQMYVQEMIKTEDGYRKVGKPYPHKVLLGDTIRFLYKKKF